MQRFYATGRRKTSVARVWINGGKGEIKVNGKPLSDYFNGLKAEILKILYPLKIVDLENRVDMFVTVKGGGITGQAEAIRHGLNKALVEYDPNLRAKLKPLGLLSRDSRKKERKKYGRRKARASFQWSKR
ncbi:MAG: 30S ribosomal protein S9 [Deltaproteobacteria bacterium]|nr:30S ribosomal protein S9 [Deltaproteobacteria bacterium]